MLNRILLLAGFAAIWTAAGIWAQARYGFYPLHPESWEWLAIWIRHYRSFPPFIGHILVVLLLVQPAFYLLFSAFLSRRRTATLFGGRKQNALHGSARWATWRDIKKAGLTHKTGAVVGGFRKNGKLRTLCHRGPEHVLAFAPTRSGKGVGLVLPTLLTWEDSAIVLDIKGENHAKTAGWRARIGQRILKFDPSATTGSCRFNPLTEVRLGTDHEIQDAQNIAAMIIDPDGKGLKDFWLKSGFGWLTAGILYTLYLRETEGQRASLADVSHVMGGNLDTLMSSMIAFHATFNGHPRREATRIINAGGQEMKDRAPPERSGVHSSATVELKLYKDPIIARNIAASDFRLKDLIDPKRKTTLYLVVPPSEIDRLRPLLRVVMNILLRRLMEHLPPEGAKHRTLLMLDEFTSIGKLEIFERALAFMSGYGLKAFLIVQDLSQLQQTYGRGESIMSNCHLRIAYAPNKVETARLLSDMTGKTTIVQHKTSTSRGAMEMGGRLSQSTSETARPLLTADECMQLPGARKSRLDPEKITHGGIMLIFPAGCPPVRGHQLLYFQNPLWLRRARIPAPEPQKAPALLPPPVPSSQTEKKGD